MFLPGLYDDNFDCVLIYLCICVIYLYSSLILDGMFLFSWICYNIKSYNEHFFGIYSNFYSVGFFFFFEVAS